MSVQELQQQSAGIRRAASKAYYRGRVERLDRRESAREIRAAVVEMAVVAMGSRAGSEQEGQQEQEVQL